MNLWQGGVQRPIWEALRIEYYFRIVSNEGLGIALEVKCTLKKLEEPSPYVGRTFSGNLRYIYIYEPSDTWADPLPCSLEGWLHPISLGSLSRRSPRSRARLIEVYSHRLGGDPVQWLAAILEVRRVGPKESPGLPVEPPQCSWVGQFRAWRFGWRHHRSTWNRYEPIQSFRMVVDGLLFFKRALCWHNRIGWSRKRPKDFNPFLQNWHVFAMVPCRPRLLTSSHVIPHSIKPRSGAPRTLAGWCSVACFNRSYPKRSMYAIYAYIGVVWVVNVGIYSSPMECLGIWVKGGKSLARGGVRMQSSLFTLYIHLEPKFSYPSPSTTFHLLISHVNLHWLSSFADISLWKDSYGFFMGWAKADRLWALLHSAVWDSLSLGCWDVSHRSKLGLAVDGSWCVYSCGPRQFATGTCTLEIFGVLFCVVCVDHMHVTVWPWALPRIRKVLHRQGEAAKGVLLWQR